MPYQFKTPLVQAARRMLSAPSYNQGRVNSYEQFRYEPSPY